MKLAKALIRQALHEPIHVYINLANHKRPNLNEQW